MRDGFWDRIARSGNRPCRQYHSQTKPFEDKRTHPNKDSLRQAAFPPRFADLYEDRLDHMEDNDESDLTTADYDLEDQLNRLLETSEGLRRAYNVVASREGFDGDDGVFRRLRRLSNADRDTVWERVAETVRQVREAARYVGDAATMDEVAKARWKAIEDDGERLDQLSRQAGR